MHARNWAAGAVMLAALITTAGCGDGNSGSLATVSGVVTQNGAPVDGAKVIFHSTVESGGKRESYSALTDSNGKYLIATVGKEPGIPPGMYRVTVVKLSMQSNQNLPEDFDQGQIEASGMAKNTLFKEYENFATTKLSATLEAGKNEANFDLKTGK